MNFIFEWEKQYFTKERNDVINGYGKYTTRIPDVVSYEFYFTSGVFPVKRFCLYSKANDGVTLIMEQNRKYTE